MNKQTKYDITFVVPVHNTAPYLAQCLDSIIQQDINKEIIVIDDGSTDESNKILTDYAQRFPFIRLIYQENQGVSHARNIGLDLANGDYIYFIDSDDYLIAKFDFQAYIKAMRKYNAAILKGSALWESMQLHFLPVTTKVKETALAIYQNGEHCPHYMELISSTKYIEALAQAKRNAELWTQIYSVHHLRTHHIRFDETLTHGEDVLFVIQALTKQECLIIESSELFYFYRYREGSAVNKLNNTTAFLGAIAAKNAMLHYVLQHDFTPSIRKNILLLGVCYLIDISKYYFCLDDTAKQTVNDELTVDLLGLFLLYEALNITQHGNSYLSFEQIKSTFQPLLKT